MTLLDLYRLLGRYWKLVVALPLVFALATGAFMIIRGQSSSYTSTAYIVTGTSAQLQGVNGLASSLAREYGDSNSGYSATAKSDTASLTVSVSVTGPDSAKVGDAANEIANSAVEEAQTFYGKDNLSARVEKASAGTRNTGSSLITYVLVAILAGLFAAVCAVVAIDAVRRPVKGSADLAAASGMPVLGELPGDSGERLLANARFASKKEGELSVIVVPVRASEPASLVGMMMSRAAKAEPASRGSGVKVSTCAPLLQGVSAAYEARNADAAVVVAAQWTDSRKDVESTAAELHLAGANAVGCVLVKEAGMSKRRKGKSKAKGRR